MINRRTMMKAAVAASAAIGLPLTPPAKATAEFTSTTAPTVKIILHGPYTFRKYPYLLDDTVNKQFIPMGQQWNDN